MIMIEEVVVVDTEVVDVVVEATRDVTEVGFAAIHFLNSGVGWKANITNCSQRMTRNDMMIVAHKDGGRSDQHRECARRS